ncbi:MAG: hypothetical protein ACREEM_26460 [Blastocatellia bacterium]
MEHSDRHAVRQSTVHADSRIRGKRRIRPGFGGEVRSGKLSFLFLSLSAVFAERLGSGWFASDYIFTLPHPRNLFYLPYRRSCTMPRFLLLLVLFLLSPTSAFAQSKWPEFDLRAHAVYPDLENQKIYRFSGCLRLLDDRILCAGATTIGSDAKFVPTTETAIYNPRTEKWVTGAPLHTARRMQVMNLLPDGRVLMVGGYNEITDPGGYPYSAVRSVEIYDPYNNKSELVPISNYTGHYFYTILLTPPASIILPDSRMLLISNVSGSHSIGGGALILDWKKGLVEIVPTPPGHNLQSSMTLSYLQDGRILFSIHRIDQSTPQTGPKDAAPNLSIFDPATKEWSPLPLQSPANPFYSSWFFLPYSLPSQQFPVFNASNFYVQGGDKTPNIDYFDVNQGVIPGFRIDPLSGDSQWLVKMTATEWGEVLVVGNELSPAKKERILNLNTKTATYFDNPFGWRQGTIPLSNGDFWNMGYSYLNPVDTPLNGVVTTSGSYSIKSLARGSLITLFGEKLTEGQAAPQLTLLTASKESLPVRVLYSSPTQINAVLPDKAGIEGRALLCLGQSAQQKCTPITVVRTAPDVLTADSSGRGAAAALFYRAKKDGTAGRYEPVATLENGKSVLIPAQPPAEDEVLFLVLFGTGWRNHARANGRLREGVSVYLNDTPAQVTFASAQGDFSGLDQMNIQIVPSLKGKQIVQIQADGKLANPVEIALRD